MNTLQLQVKDRVAIVTITRPDKLNALNAECKSELQALFAELRTQPEAGAVILTGSGSKSFVAGTDIGEITPLGAETGKEFARNGQAIFDQIQHLGKPVIAAVNGYALGGGLEIALACHLRIAADNARFGQPEVSLGVIPGYGGTQRLSRLVGAGRATEMILTGNPIGAQEALAIGLVNKVVPAAELMGTAEAVARTILEKGPLAVRMALKAINASMEMPLSEGLAVEAALFGECCSTDDCKEGVKAFLEKRKPVFKGK